MRAMVGDSVTLFDGHGFECEACIASCQRDRVELELEPWQQVSRELPFELVLGVALPKGDRQKWLVEKLTELGVTKLVPLVTHHGVDQASKKSTTKLVRAVVEASKQCGRNQLMQVADPTPLAEFLQLEATVRLFAHPDGAPLDLKKPSPGQTVCAAIGPEGGFSPEELELANTHGWQVVGLGASILRIETAALAVAAATIYS